MLFYYDHLDKLEIKLEKRGRGVGRSVTSKPGSSSKKNGVTEARGEGGSKNRFRSRVPSIQLAVPIPLSYT